MTTEVKPETPAATATPAPAPAAQAVDVEAIVKRASEAAIEKTTKIAEQKAQAMIDKQLGAARRALGGGDEAPPDVGASVITRFAQDPVKLLSDVSSYTLEPVSYTHLTLPTIHVECRSRWSPYH